MLDPVEAYALWAPSYTPNAHNPLMHAEELAMLRVLDTIGVRRALDVGTGSGRYLTRLCGADVCAYGLDLSPVMLAHNASGAPLVCGDARRLPFRDASFDLVVSSLTVGHLPDLDVWFSECARVLARGGHLVFSDVHPSWEATGWLRTFSASDGRLFAVRHHWHGVDAVTSALAAHDFQLQTIDEPRLGEDTSPSVVSWRRRWGNPPVALVVHAVRT